MAFTYQGYTIEQPGVIATQSSSGMASSTGNQRLVVLLGVSSGGGQPKTLQMLGGQQDAINKLLGGPLQTAAVRAYVDAQNPAVAYMRVNPALQSSLALLSAGAVTVINLTSVDYGVYTNLISAQILAGSIQGLKAVVILDNATYSQDNLYQGILSIQYAGTDASALVTVSNSTGQMAGSSGASGSESLKWTAPFATYQTIQQLANFINSQSGWSAMVLTSSPNGATANALDDMISVQAKTTAATVTATLQAVINWFNTTGIVIAIRPASIGALPAAMAAPSYLAGGSNGTPTNTDWADAFSALQNAPQVRIIVPITGDAGIHAMTATHCAYMSDPTVRCNRVAICGGVSGETVSLVLVRAANLNSRRVSLAWSGIQDIDPITQLLTTYDPFYVAAQAAGLLSTLPITQALTRQHITAKALEGTLQSTLQKTDYDILASNGIMAIKFFANQNGNYYGYVRSLTTWLQDQDLDNLELSMVCNEDYVDIRVGNDLDSLVGQSGGPIGAGQVQSTVVSALKDLQTEGAIVGDSNMPAYSNVVSRITAQQALATYNATIPAPMNFFGVSASFQAYSSLVAA